MQCNKFQHVYQCLISLLHMLTVNGDRTKDTSASLWGKRWEWNHNNNNTRSRKDKFCNQLLPIRDKKCQDKRQQWPEAEGSWEQGEGCNQKSGKQNCFSVFVSCSRLVIFRQADKHKICQSESPASWRISPSHMSPIHGPAPSRMGGGAGCKPVHQFVSQCLRVSICKYESGMVSVGKAANVCPPPRGRVISEPGHTEARGRTREREMDFAHPRPPLWVWWWVCGGVAWMDGGVSTKMLPVWAAYELTSLVAPVSYSQEKFAAWPRGRVKHRPGTEYMRVYGGCTRAGAFWCPCACVCIRESKEKKGLQPLRDMGSDLLLWPVHAKQTVLLQSQDFLNTHTHGGVMANTQFSSYNNKGVIR